MLRIKNNIYKIPHAALRHIKQINACDFTTSINDDDDDEEDDDDDGYATISNSLLIALSQSPSI